MKLLVCHIFVFVKVLIFPFFPAPLVELSQNEFVREKVLETGRIFFSNSNLTINLLPAIAALALGLILGIPLLALLFQPAADTADTGYGAPAAEYGAPSSSYGAPSSSYDAQYRSVSFFLQK